MNDRDAMAAGRREERRPTPALVKDTVDLSDEYDLVAAVAGQNDSGVQTFGPYLRDKRRNLAAGAAAEMLGAKEGTKPDLKASVEGSVSTPTRNVGGGSVGMTPVERAVGCSLKNVGAYKSLDRRAQVVALVNEVGTRRTCVMLANGFKPSAVVY